MERDLIPEDLQRFIAAHIDSIAHIEALLLLRASKSAAWSASTLANRIYVDEATAKEVLRRLQVDGLARLEGERYCFGCNSSEKEQMVERLAEAYRRFLIPVTNLIHATPRRIRQFADAFRLRKGT